MLCACNSKNNNTYCWFGKYCKSVSSICQCIYVQKWPNLRGDIRQETGGQIYWEEFRGEGGIFRGFSGANFPTFKNSVKNPFFEKILKIFKKPKHSKNQYIF